MTADAAPHLESAFDVVVIGGSAGALDPMRTIFAGLEPSLPAAVAVVLHRSPHIRSVLSRILGRSGPLPVADAVEGSRMQRGRVLVAPTDRSLVLEPGGGVSFRTGQTHFTASAIDPVLESAAAVYGARVVAVILSGGGDDGTPGCRAVHKAGGVVLVQDPATAESTRMPDSVIAAGVADRALPVEEMPALIHRLVREGRAALGQAD